MVLELIVFKEREKKQFLAQNMQDVLLTVQADMPVNN